MGFRMVMTSKDSMDVLLEAMMIDLVRRLAGHECIQAFGRGLRGAPRCIARDYTDRFHQGRSERERPDGLTLSAGKP